MKVNKLISHEILQPCSLDWLDYQIDPYIGCEHRCCYCYILNQSQADNQEGIFMYENLMDQLGRELSGLDPQQIYMGMNTDPYQPCEAEYRQTRQVLELLAQRGFSVCMLTKSDLVIRDIDLYKSMPGSSVGTDIAFQDESVRQLFEANAPSNQRRIEALRKLKGAGIETYVLINPVMPFLTDAEQIIQTVAPFAQTIWIYPLHMTSDEDRNWRNVKDILTRHFQDLSERFRQIAFSKQHPYWVELREKLERVKFDKKLNLEIKV